MVLPPAAAMTNANATRDWSSSRCNSGRMIRPRCRGDDVEQVALAEILNTNFNADLTCSISCRCMPERSMANTRSSSRVRRLISAGQQQK
jgi:hypothetical protein